METTERIEQLARDNALYALRLAIINSELGSFDIEKFDNFIINYMDNEKNKVS